MVEARPAEIYRYYGRKVCGPCIDARDPGLGNIEGYLLIHLAGITTECSECGGTFPYHMDMTMKPVIYHK